MPSNGSCWGAFQFIELSWIADIISRVNRVALSISALALLALACSSTVRVPPSDYGNPGSASAYHVRTVDDRKFSVARYSVSDSILVIEEWSKSTSDAANGSPATPFEIPLRDVESIDRVSMDRGKASGWVLGLGAAFLAVLFFAGLSGGVS